MPITPPPPHRALTQQERELLNAWDTLNEDQRRRLFAALKAISAGASYVGAALIAGVIKPFPRRRWQA